MSIELILVNLCNDTIELLSFMRSSHGILRGTHEAALFEAQGGQIGTDGFNHLKSLRDATTGLENRQDLLKLRLNQLSGVKKAGSVSSQIKNVYQPLLRLSEQLLSSGRETQRVAAELQKTDPTRLRGVTLAVDGGVRTVGSLVSSQLNAQAKQLAERGIEPRLIPSTRPALQGVLMHISKLPLDAREVAIKLSAALASMRLVVTTLARHALLAGRASLATGLTAIGQALLTMASRLSMPVLILVRRTGDDLA